MTLPLHTERLVVREFTIDDLDDLEEIFADPCVSEDDGETLSRAQTRDWLVEEIGYVARVGIGRYAIVLVETGRVIGGVSLVRRELDQGVEVELGYFLRSDLWGRGLATEAARALVAEARTLGLPRLVCFIKPGNRRSEAVARRSGLRPGATVEWFAAPHVRWQLALAEERRHSAPTVLP